jgi:hypothetical protein
LCAAVCCRCLSVCLLSVCLWSAFC